ncbi:MAG: branched-chain amino acid ABC transporter substrate-binding protein [Spirochaetales bacterium]|nr:branched-chain amino acid ABC transporter substrate-binding protein [Spirochaetales bacterium]
MTKRFLIVIALAAFALSAWGGAQGEVIRIGVAAPMTGNSAAVGQDFVNGAKLAVSEYNARGGVLGKRIELVAIDDMADPKQATLVAQQFVDKKVSGVVGHFTSGTTIPTTPIYNRARIPQVTPASNPDVTGKGYDNVFSLNPSDIVQGSSAAKVAVPELNLRRIAIVHDKQAFGQGVAEEFASAARAAGATVTSVNGITPGELDFKAVLTKVNGERPDAVYFGGVYTEGGLVLKQLRELGSKALFLAPDSCYGGEFIKTAGAKNAEGAIVSFPAPPLDSTPELEAFVESYKKTYNQDTILGEYGYDAALLILQAIEKAGSAEGEEVIRALHGNTFEGTLHSYSFDESGQLALDRFPVYEVRDGEFTFKGFF